MRLRPTVASGPSAFGYSEDPWSLVLFVAISIAIHLSVVIAAVVIPKFQTSRRISLPSAISVRMVSLPGTTAPPAATETSPVSKVESVKETAEPVPPPPPKTEPKKAVPVEKPKVEMPQPEPKKAISLSKEKPKKVYKTKKSLKKKTYQPKKSVKKTIDRLEKKVKDSDDRKVKRAIDKIRKQVGKTGPVDQLKQKMARQGSGVGGAASGLGGGRRSIEMMDIYRAEVPYRIQENWAFSNQLAGVKGNIEAVLVVKIMPDGYIADIWFEKRSGNSYLDESAFKAIKKSSPLPPLPPGYRRPFYNLGLIFTPQGVK